MAQQLRPNSKRKKPDVTSTPAATRTGLAVSGWSPQRDPQSLEEIRRLEAELLQLREEMTRIQQQGPTTEMAVENAVLSSKLKESDLQLKKSKEAEEALREKYTQLSIDYGILKSENARLQKENQKLSEQSGDHVARIVESTLNQIAVDPSRYQGLTFASGMSRAAGMSTAPSYAGQTRPTEAKTQAPVVTPFTDFTVNLRENFSRPRLLLIGLLGNALGVNGDVLPQIHKKLKEESSAHQQLQAQGKLKADQVYEHTALLNCLDSYKKKNLTPISDVFKKQLTDWLQDLIQGNNKSSPDIIYKTIVDSVLKVGQSNGSAHAKSAYFGDWAMVLQNACNWHEADPTPILSEDTIKSLTSTQELDAQKKVLGRILNRLHPKEPQSIFPKEQFPELNIALKKKYDLIEPRKKQLKGITAPAPAPR